MATATETTTERTAEIVRAYFEELEQGSADAPLRHYGPRATGHIVGIIGPVDGQGIADYFASVHAAFPDYTFRILDLIAQDDRAAVRWRITGTFAGPGRFNGMEPTGARIEIEGIDHVVVADGQIAQVVAYTDSMTVARQLAVLPEAGSKAEQRMTAAVNARTRLGRRLRGGVPVEVADGVWRVQGWPARCNVYLVRDSGGVTAFDAGARTMVNDVAAAAASLGGLRRIVLGHAHTDHRGTAPYLGVPVHCHPDDVIDAEGSGGFRYWGEGLPKLSFPTRQLHRWLHRRFWDGGPVKISGTVGEGDEVAGFRVVHLPGHAPGLIALVRDADGVALTTDCFYTLDNRGRDCPPHVPIHAYNYDTEQAIASIRKLAALDLRICFPGHANPVTGDVRTQLEHAADAG